MLRPLFFLLLVVSPLWLASAVPAPENRVWQTVTGQRIEGSLLKVDGDKITLQRKNSSKTITVSRDDLVPTDTVYLDELQKKKEEDSSTKSDKSDSGTSGEQVASGLFPRTKDQIRTTLRQVLRADKPKDVDKDVHAAICRLNAYRFLSGVPYKVVADPDMTAGAIDAAQACAAAGKLSHELDHSTDKCNLSVGQEIVPSVDGYMEDPGDNNREKRGHRLWCLNPPMAKTGFGHKGKFGAMWSMDQSGEKPTTSWSYPGHGFYPLEYVHGNAWSFYMPDFLPEDAKVRIWKLGATPKEEIPWDQEPKGREVTVKFSLVNKNAINFEPEPGILGRRGIYWVRVEGTGLREQYVTEIF